MVLTTLDDHGYSRFQDLAFVQCFDAQETRRMREELGTKLKLTQLIGENDWDEADTDFDRLRTAAGLKNIAEYAQSIGPAMKHVWAPSENSNQATQTRLVALARKENLLVHPYTLRADALPDYASSFEQLVNMFCDAGVDGMFTDFPDQALRIIEERGE